MPTTVSAARQCLTPDAARALDDAVSVARRRAHAQTTSLHALHALLALPSSALRRAVSVARNAAYSPRLQLRALDLCSAAALDRLPSASPPPDEPPVSNSFMAAIKRSQANQRRHPDSFHYYQQQQQQLQQQQQQQGSISCVKVELQQLVLSILDDPVVSRVFGEAGFRSCDVKLAFVRPPGSLLRMQRPRRPPPPMFLCNLTGDADDPGRRSFSFPFAGGLFDAEENFRRVGEVLARDKERNPLLVGGGASEAVRRMVERGGGGVFPAEIAGLSFVSVESEVLKFVSTESGSEVLLRSRFDELNRSIESCAGPGVVVSFGDLKVLAEESLVDPVRFVVAQLTKLLELHRPKVWLMGATASYEMYSKFLMRFPSIEKDWDLQLLNITSVRPQSLMESFVPFGGFFPLPSDLKEPFSSSTYQSISRCSTCNEKCEQEISSALNGGCTLSVADQYQESLPPWLQMTEVNANNILNVAKAKDDETALKAKVAGVQRKFSDICRRLNHSPPVSEAGSFQVRAQMFPGITGFPFATAHNDKADNHSGSSSSINATLKGSVCENVFPIMSVGLQKFPLMDQKILRPVVSEAKSDNITSKLQGRPSKGEGLQMQGYRFPECSISNSSNPSHLASPSSAASVATDLGLGTIYASSSAEELNKPTFQAHNERLKDISGCFPSNVDVVNSNITNPSVRSSSCSAPDLSGQADPKDFKALFRSLVEKVGRQDEAIHAISQTIACCRTSNERRRGASMRRDTWFSFIGPDRVAKKRIAVALAEIFFGSRHNLICVDLSSHDGSSTHSNTIFDFHEISGYDVKFRGKTVVDYIAEEITKKPLSIVFLENIDKADLLAQSRLSQAIKTGKFQDTHGREVRINNSIFVTTARFLKDKKTLSFGKDLAKFSEERILEAQRLEMQILIDCIPEVKTLGNNTTNVTVTLRKDSFDPALVNKRKRTGSYDGHDEMFESGKRAPKISKCLDLNLPIEEMEADYSDSGSSKSETISENSQLWLEDFLDQMNETVFFKPFDFDTLANTILKEISGVLTKTVGSEVLLEIDSKVMEQILAAAWLADGKRAIEDWVDRVLGRSLMEAHKRYSLNARSLLKLLNCEGLHMEEQSPGVCLPARVILN